MEETKNKKKIIRKNNKFWLTSNPKWVILILETNKKPKQPGKPKAPKTMSHIPVSERLSGTNSQEDAQGVAEKENTP